ncbi:hypothetical protein D3C72_880470 [compost metagenome]
MTTTDTIQLIAGIAIMAAAYAWLRRNELRFMERAGAAAIELALMETATRSPYTLDELREAYFALYALTGKKDHALTVVRVAGRLRVLAAAVELAKRGKLEAAHG